MSQNFSSLEAELEYYNFSFPLLNLLEEHLEKQNYLKKRKIGWHCHLTALTSATAAVLLKSGAELFLSETSASTSDPRSIAYMQKLGAKVFLGEQSCLELLKHSPEIISDTGFVLSSEYLKSISGKESYLFAASEITSSGIQKAKDSGPLPMPVLNINDGQLKTHIENFHGVGDGVIDSLFRESGRIWSGRPAAVLGYGKVGAGVAARLRSCGALVKIVEKDPVKKLIAHYDGFDSVNLEEALRFSQLLISATGCRKLISTEAFELAADRLLFMNVGHWPDEIDLESLQKISCKQKNLSTHLQEFELAKSGKKLYLIAGGGPANVVMLSGSPEPTFIHLCTEILAMNHLLKMESSGIKLESGLQPLPAEIEAEAALLALKCLSSAR
ncbi:MAG: hypothetical protein K2X27_21765 [Candidatus Obscuribacterales bacterium]|nr:hypothetical protein [Candidatus Obscuribacterales bacterium]